MPNYVTMNPFVQGDKIYKGKLEEKIMKRIVAIGLVLCMVAAALVGCGAGSSRSAKTVKIGVFEPQSGDNGAGGKQEVLGMQYANTKTPTVEIGGETYNVELV